MVPATGDTNAWTLVFALLQTVWALTGNTDIIGVGLTVMLNDCCGPTQEFAVGVTKNDPLIAEVPLFVAVNEGIELPGPENKIPIA